MFEQPGIQNEIVFRKILHNEVILLRIAAVLASGLGFSMAVTDLARGTKKIMTSFHNCNINFCHF